MDRCRECFRGRKSRVSTFSHVHLLCAHTTFSVPFACDAPFYILSQCNTRLAFGSTHDCCWFSPFALYPLSSDSVSGYALAYKHFVPHARSALQQTSLLAKPGLHTKTKKSSRQLGSGRVWSASMKACESQGEAGKAERRSVGGRCPKKAREAQGDASKADRSSQVSAQEAVFSQNLASYPPRILAGRRECLSHHQHLFCASRSRIIRLGLSATNVTSPSTQLHQPSLP